MSREIIGQGHEHTVYRVNNNDEWVLKKPRFIQRSLYSAQEIQQEITTNTQLLDNENVIIPPTRLFPINGSYIIAQKFIEEDFSMDIREQFLEQDNTYLLQRYNNQPKNFISNQGNIYWIDPTKGPITRILEKYHIMNEPTYRKISDRIKRIIGRKF
jgi:hypothetical protein